MKIAPSSNISSNDHGFNASSIQDSRIDEFGSGLKSAQANFDSGSPTTNVLQDTNLISQRNTRPIVGPDLRTDERGILDGGPMAAIRYGLDHAQGFMIGDVHGDTYITEFLEDYMPAFRNAGVQTFFIEMIRSEDQDILDRFMETGDRTELAAYLQPGWDKGPGWIDSVIDVIEAARQQGIQVVGIDIPFSGADRLETSNPHWTGIIQDHMAGSSHDQKYLVFGGQAHAGDYPANTGVDARLGIMSGSFQSNYDASIPDRQIAPGEARVNPNPNASTFVFGRPTD